MTFLLDVNVLIAFAWPSHAHHARARGWFTELRGAAWATCPPTELGFVRLSANPSVVDPPLALMEAAATVVALRAMQGHDFWADDTTAAGVDWTAVTTYRHVPDAHLVAIATRHGGRVATLDRRLVQRFGQDVAVLVT